MSELPETILQFGAGNFLRAFADCFVHHANEAGQKVGRVVVVQSTPGRRAELLNRQQGRYHVVVRGLEGGKEVDRVETVESISRALVASDQWDEVLALARSPDLRYVISNTTEKGFDLDPADGPESAPPRSFPAKLLRVLEERHRSGAGPLTVIPCELLDDNASRLRAILAGMARRWERPEPFIEWLEKECSWWGTLVDRIVPGRPASHPLLDEDELLVTAEPFAFWAIRSDRPFFEHPAIRLVDDVEPYALRKVRILNGAHTALVSKTRDTGVETVREAVLHPELRPWLEKLLFEEILPAVGDRIHEGETFAREVLERFENPFIEHKLADIALHHETKVRVRLVPTRNEYLEKFGRPPALLEELLAAEGAI